MSKRPYRYPLNESFFEAIDSEDKAYWLGFITADGGIRDTPSKVLYIALKGEDHGHLMKFQRAIERDSPLYFALSGKSPTARLGVGNAKMCADLLTCGVGSRKSHTQEPFPLTDPDLERHYWRGVFDGDGSMSFWTNSKGREYYSVSLAGSTYMAAGFRDFLANRGITHGTIEPHGSVRKYKTSGLHPPLRILQLLYAGSTVYLERKRILVDVMFDAAPSEYRESWQGRYRIYEYTREDYREYTRIARSTAIERCLSAGRSRSR